MVRENLPKGWLVMLALFVAALILAAIGTQVPVGTTVWVFNIILIALSFYSHEPRFPPFLAAVSTALVVINACRPTGAIDPIAGYVACTLGITTFWTVATITQRFITAQQALEEKEKEALTVSESLQVETWLRKGIAEVNDAMRGVQSPTVLCENLLTRVAEYVGASIGSFYLADEVTFLKRAAIYAYANAGDGGHTFGANEGLLGQAATQLKTIELSDVPDNHCLKIRSSFGDITPKHITAIPVVFDSTLRGVIELGFLKPVTSATRALLAHIQENIGIAIDLSVSRRLLQDTLRKARGYAEELQSQQEELKTVNEEMTEQAKALALSQTKLELQQNTLEGINAELEEKQTLLEEQKAALQETNGLLRTSKRESEMASQYKSEFLSNMSHELRTPLNSILILAQLLSDNKRGTLSDGEVDSALTIVSAGNDLLTLINDILDLSKIESGKLDLHPELVDLEALTTRLDRTFRPLAEKRKLALRMTVDATASLEIYTDSQRLEQILSNFLSNALKFTEVGMISLHVKRAHEGDKVVAIAVSDTGIGISKDKQSVIFEAFKQADGTTSRRYGGTGLGLSISRELAALLQGEIRLESTEGQGSTFTVLLPAKLNVIAPPTGSLSTEVEGQRIRDPASPAKVAGDTRARTAAFHDDRDALVPGDRILLAIEDDPRFARILAQQVRALGFKCLLSEDGECGLADARRYLPNGIILDLQLPVLSGMEILEQLKKSPLTRHIPVHVVSGLEHKKSALHLGAVGYLMKPVSAQALAAAFAKIEAVAAGSLKKVLIVEDDEKQLKAMQTLIADLKGVETIGARTAGAALVELRASTIDCMVLDLRLPDMSGLTLLETMAADKSLSPPPVIVYTGSDLTRDQESALRRYTDSIIIKGAHSHERLLDETVLFLHRIESELPTAKQKLLKDYRERDQIFSGSRILVVDDDTRNIFALSRLLEEKGATVSVARNGQEALDRLNAGDDHHLVLMDVMMPVMDGLEAMRRLRADPRFAKLPIIALTAKAMKGDQENCIEAGASDYLAKPINTQRLESLVRVWLAPQGF